MKRIYVSYRRADTSESYGRIAERLRNYFGSEATLRSDAAYTADGAVVPIAEFKAYVADAMKRCAVLLLLIGPRWVQADEPNGWRLSDFDDPVRLEIEAALREGVPIVPALVQHGRMPEADELPPSLRLLLEQDQTRAHKRGRESLLSLVSRAGMQVRRDPDFGGDVQRLCEVIENLAGLEATSLERASGTINRALRSVTLAASAALVVHAGILAYFALSVVFSLAPAFALPTTWLPIIISSSLIDWGIYFLAGYVTSRRTGDVGLGISAAVTSYVIGLVIGLAIFADITWSRWEVLSVPAPIPALLIGGPGWLVGPLVLLMRPFLLLFAVLALGIPLGLVASFALGSLGGILGVRVSEFVSAHQQERARGALIQSEPDTMEMGGRRRSGISIVRRRAPSDMPLRRGATPAGKLFISYRRDDSAVMCGAIYDRLTDIFGVDTVFKDVDMIPVGTNFEKFISSTLEQCVAQVVVIGPRWVSISTPEGLRRLDDARDFVRLEVESALRSGLKVIPVLVQGAQLPTAEELPESLRPLVDCTPISVRYAPDFDGDLRDLALDLAPAVWPNPAQQSLMKRITSLEAGPRATQTASLFWPGLFLFYGVLVGIEIVRGLSLASGAQTTLWLPYLAAAPVIMTLWAAIGGAHLGYTTGQAGRSFLRAWRAVLVGCVAMALTTQIYGATRYQSAILAVQDPNYRDVMIGVLAAAAGIALGPGLVSALSGAAIASFLRRRRSLSVLSSLFVREPKTLQVLYRDKDMVAGARITAGLSSYFGRQATPSKRRRLQAGAPGSAGEIVTSDQLERTLRRSAAVLVLVGPSWREGGDVESGMSDPEDPLRVRIEATLALGRPIVPILLTNATMPSPDQLPASAHEFAMLNAAWVRDEPDHTGDMRRLTRVIERMTRLRPAERATVTWIPLLLGVVLSALALIGADALVARLVVSAYHQLNQATLILVGGEVILADLLMYGITAGLVTRWSGKRQNGALAALLGASLAMLADAVALRLALTPGNASLEILGSRALVSQALGTITIYLVVRPPFQAFGAIAASALGSFYGRIAYRGRERSRQERRLYAMARAGVQSQSLASLSAPALGGPAMTQSRVPEMVAMAADDLETVPETAMIAEQAIPLAGSAGEEIHLERLITEIQATHQRARAQRQRRLYVVLGVAAAALVIAAIGTGLVYQSQIHGVAVNAANAAQQTSVAAAATATYVTSPSFVFSAPEFGPKCGSDSAGAVWSARPQSGNINVICNGSDTTVINHDLHPALLTLTLGYPYARAYQLHVDITSFNYTGTCAGLVASGQAGSPGSAIEYVVCEDQAWSITSVKGDGTPIKILAHGYTNPQAIYHIAVKVSADEEQFSINGHVVKTMVSQQEDGATDFTGVCLNYGPDADDYVGVDVSNFIYQPMAPTASPTG